VYTDEKMRPFLAEDRALLTEHKALLVEAELFRLRQGSFESDSISVH